MIFYNVRIIYLKNTYLNRVHRSKTNVPAFCGKMIHACRALDIQSSRDISDLTLPKKYLPRDCLHLGTITLRNLRSFVKNYF